MLIRRKGIKLLLMKAMYLRWTARDRYLDNLGELVQFSLEALGRFAKMELYFAWKFLKHGEQFDFFKPILRRTEKALEKLNGMSWDPYSLRHNETLACTTHVGKFYVPFFATFDRGFKALVRACPIRALLIDDRDKRINTIFWDDAEFFQDLHAATAAETTAELLNPARKIKRLSESMREQAVDNWLSTMAEACRLLIAT